MRREAGLDLEIITCEEEARLAVTGCVPLLDPAADRALVFDIGGGSSELIWVAVDDVRRPRVEDWMSLPFGVLAFVGEGHHGASASAYRALYEGVCEQLVPFETRHRIRDKVAQGRVQMLGTSGTVTTLAGIHLGLRRYERARVDGSFLTFEAVEAMHARLAAMDHAARVAHPCIGPERADLVLAGCAILEAICAAWPVGRLRVADRGVREGILLGLMRAAEAETAAPPAPA